MKSPLTVSYKDLVTYAEARLAWMEKEYPKMKLQGTIHADTATKNLAIQKELLRLLRKGYKSQQTNLFDIFNK